MKRARKHDEDNGFGAWGGYMEAKISKLEDQFLGVTTKQSDQISSIFNGISIFVNGYTNPSATELKTLMAEHGGIFHHYHRPGKTTYVIASNLPDVKVKSITTCKIISAQWVVDCIKAEKLIDHTKYLLYTNQSKTQPKISFSSKSLKEDAKYDVDFQKSPDLISSGESYPDINFVDSGPSTSKLNLKDESTIVYVKDDKTLNINETEIKVNIEASTSKINLNEQTTIADVENNETFNSHCEKNTSVNISKPNISTSNADNKKNSIKTAVDPGFLTEFYNNSRLHHIATLGAGFKQYITQLREKSVGTFPGIDELKNIQKRDIFTNINGRIIMHIDMDCFFVSVGLRNRPHLKGLPIAVTHSKGGAKSQARPGTDIRLEIEMYKQRHQSNSKDNNASNELSAVESRLCNINEFDSLSEIASCSYEARKAGITNGMFMGAALKLCPDLKTIPYDFEGYKEVAYTLYDTIARYTLDIEAVSCDEMFVDCTDLLKTTNTTVFDFAGHIRSEIKQKTSCPCSTGFGSNKLLARMATKKAKPDGQYHLQENYVEEYLEEIPISDLPGVGRSTMSRLKTLGCNQCGDLRNLSLSTLQKEFGNKTGEALYKNCRGIDERPLVYEQVRKSVSAEVNYGIRFSNLEEYETFLGKLAAEVHSRLKEINKKGRCITLKLMVRAQEAPKETAKYMGHGFCDNMSKCQTLNTATDDLEIITKAVLNISKTMETSAEELRGIGIQISRLENIHNTSVNNTKGSLTAFFKKAAEKTTKPVILDNTGNNNEISLNNDNANVSTVVDVTVQKSANSIKSFAAPIKKFESIPNQNTSVLRLRDAQNDMETINELTNNNSPQKKQPQKKSPQKKGKPKEKKGKTLARHKSNNTLDNFFGSKKNSFPTDVKELGIDPEVLASLPDDIRAEVIRDYRIQAQKLNKPGPSKKLESPKPKIEVDTEFLDAMPEDIRKEIEAEMIERNMTKSLIIDSPKNDPKIAPNQNRPKSDSVCGVEYSAIFGNITKTRSLIRVWIKNEISPKHCDVEMLMRHLMSQVEEDIQNVYFILKFLHRVISEQLPREAICDWHKAYHIILEGVQNAVKNFYGNKLLVENQFKCDTCCEV